MVLHWIHRCYDGVMLILGQCYDGAMTMSLWCYEFFLCGIHRYVIFGKSRNAFVTRLCH
jgi:hypothetical protein